ncbi:MAG: DUF262 domain-containing protein, partial [Erythrobacter sp.]|nr:DUF262 domain-containing protein [Erythrobacter sp.]
VDYYEGFKQLKLKCLSEINYLNIKSYEDLKLYLSHDQDVAAFENSTIRTVVIRNWKQEAYLWEVFLRINTGSVQLSPQELRQALHPGPFSNFVDQYSGDSEGLRNALNLKSPDFRMRDAEILLRYISYRNFAEDYSGNLKQFLDETTRKFNESWEESEEKVRNQMAEREAAFAFTEQIFGPSDYLRKWNGEQFEARKNRAVFDIMLYWFSNDELRASLEGKGDEIVQAFKALCESDPNFLAAIERTTKTTEANDWRFNKWADALSRISGVELAPLDFGA